MARKKKETIETPIEEKQEEIKTTSASSLSYQGTVKVSVQRDNTVLSTKTYHNKGFTSLFKFICKALAGEFNTDLRPCKIVLFKDDYSTTPDENKTLTSEDALTTFILNDTTAVVGTSSDTVTYHFRIPYSYINTAITNRIYKAALYGTAASRFEEDKCAVYLFTKGSGQDISWDPLEINSTLKGNYSLVIEWTMQISNKS